MDIFKYSNIGNRENNQDYLVSMSLGQDSSLHLVADGMGGYAFGDIASKVVGDSYVYGLSRNMTIEEATLEAIKNIQKEDNRPVFRLAQSKELKERFDNLLNDTDIILNPIHTPMGNQGKMKKRREYLSDKNRYYFSTSQNDTREIKGKKKTIPMDSAVLQYALHNGIALQEERYDTTSLYTIRVFDI